MNTRYIIIIIIIICTINTIIIIIIWKTNIKHKLIISLLEMSLIP